MTPRRMAAYVSDTDLEAGWRQSSRWCSRPPSRRPAELDGAQWVQIPEDATSIVVREYIADAATEQPAALRIEPLDAHPAADVSDAEAAEQFTAMAWTIMKLTTLHRTIKPELLDAPNTLVTSEAADLGEADTTPDNLYMIGTFRLDRRRVAGARIRTTGHPLLERDAGEHLARVPGAAAAAQLGHEQGRDARRRWCGAYRHRRQGLRPRPLAGHRGQSSRLHLLRWLDNPDPPSRVRHGAHAAGRRGERGRPVQPRRVDRAGLPMGGQRRLRNGVRRERDLARRDWAASAKGSSARRGSTTSAWRSPPWTSCGALKNRLQIVEWRNSHPEIAEEKIEQANLHRRSTPHRDHDPVRPSCAGPAAASRR